MDKAFEHESREAVASELALLHTDVHLWCDDEIIFEASDGTKQEVCPWSGICFHISAAASPESD